MNKTRLKYEKPAMQVYELKQQPQLLAGSEVLQNYDREEDDLW